MKGLVIDSLLGRRPAVDDTVQWMAPVGATRGRPVWLYMGGACASVNVACSAHPPSLKGRRSTERTLHSLLDLPDFPDLLDHPDLPIFPAPLHPV
jgi:hypothetical protein